MKKKISNGYLEPFLNQIKQNLLISSRFCSLKKRFSVALLCIFLMRDMLFWRNACGSVWLECLANISWKLIIFWKRCFMSLRYKLSSLALEIETCGSTSLSINHSFMQWYLLNNVSVNWQALIFPSSSKNHSHARVHSKATIYEPLQ